MTVPREHEEVEVALVRRLRESAELANKLVGLHDTGEHSPDDERAGTVRALGRARKVSVSMPEDLAAAVQRRVGRGEFSQYVTEAVTRRLELDLLAELSSLLAAEHGEVPDDLIAEAEAEWPDVE